jgi:hypothetical protein
LYTTDRSCETTSTIYYPLSISEALLSVEAMWKDLIRLDVCFVCELQSITGNWPPIPCGLAASGTWKEKIKKVQLVFNPSLLGFNPLLLGFLSFFGRC